MADGEKNSQPKSQSQKMETAGKAAQSKSDQDKTSGEKKCPPVDTHWIEIRLVGEDGSGIGNEKCIIIASDGKEYRGKTDSKGVLRVEGVPEGDFKVKFVDLDEDMWEEMD
jgi:hypothetical protein